MLNHASQQHPGISEDELKARFRPQELFSFTGMLARKGAPKSYLEQKKPTYALNIVGFLSGSILRILAGFMAVSGFLAGIFFGSSIAGYIVGALLLLALEFLQIRNATELYENWFSKSRIVKACFVYGLIFSSITATLAFMGVDDTIKIISETVDPFHFDETAVNPTLRADIDKADADAKEFYTAKSWKGKLDAKAGKRYDQLKAEAAALRKQYREEVSTAKISAKSEHDGLVAGKNQDDADNRFYLTIFICISEILFWLAFYHKERYEFLAAKELELTGQLNKPASPTPQTGTPFSTNGQTPAHNGRKPADLANFQ